MRSDIMKTSLRRTCLYVVSRQGFTLLELLTVMTIVSLTLALLMVGMNRARVLARRVACRSNLRQIVMAWDLYLHDYDQRFCQGVDVNHDFGGWEGKGGYALSRPLNPYLGLPAEAPSEDAAILFRCPADSGQVFNRPPQQKAYDYFGNSYQTNILLIGPNQRGVPQGDLAKLYREINKRLQNLRSDAVSEPSRLLLVGDNNWVTQWDPSFPRGYAWHRRGDCHSIGFLDGRVDFLKVRKGVFTASDYRVLPFRELDHLVADPCE
jgi:prepilin-type N-terminal cleavage/methylation domain-containing protein